MFGVLEAITLARQRNVPGARKRPQEQHAACEPQVATAAGSRPRTVEPAVEGIKLEVPSDGIGDDGPILQRQLRRQNRMWPGGKRSAWRRL